MKIITLSNDEFDAFARRHKYFTYFQTENYANVSKIIDGFDHHYLGFCDESGNLIGASLMLYKTLFWGYKYAYSPRGLLIDYEDTQLVAEVTSELKKLLKKQKFIFIKIDPPIIASERDKDGNIIKFNENVNRILNAFKKNNYEHLGFNLYDESILPRWNVSAKLHNDARVLFNNFSPDVKEKISYANSMALIVKQDETNDINKFYEFMKKVNIKKSKKYFQTLADSFNNKLKIFYAYIDTQKYTENANKLYAQEQEKNYNLANIIQTGDTIKYNIPKAINAKMESDKMLNNYKKDVIDSTKLLKSNPEGIICGASLAIEEENGVNILINYEDSEYSRYSVNTLMTYELMKFYGKLNYKYINLGSVTGNFNANSKYYPSLLNKLGFNSSILEYIGEFNMILNPTMYKIYKNKYKIKR